MTHGLDTSFLVVAEMREHPEHALARAVLARLLSNGDVLALAPQVLAEVVHIVTDSRRFTQPLEMSAACQLMEQWWTSKDVVRVFPEELAVQQFFVWMQRFSLGRKRLLDTMLASTYRQAGVRSLLTTNPTDFAVFGEFSCITPKTPSANP